MKIVIFDCEYTTWAGAQERRWTGDGEYKEIFRLGALHINWPEGIIEDTLDILIKPKINPILSEYCIALTGTLQNEIDTQGISFEDGLARFLNFCGASPVLSYGNDAGILAENILLTRCDPHTFYGKNSPSFVNIRHWIGAALPSSVAINSGKLWKHFGLEKCSEFINEHSPVSDCLSILQVLLHLRTLNYTLPL